MDDRDGVEAGRTGCDVEGRGADAFAILADGEITGLGVRREWSGEKNEGKQSPGRYEYQSADSHVSDQIRRKSTNQVKSTGAAFICSTSFATRLAASVKLMCWLFLTS